MCDIATERMHIRIGVGQSGSTKQRTRTAVARSYLGPRVSKPCRGQQEQLLSANGVCNADCGHRDHSAGTKMLIANVRYSNPYTERQNPPFEAVVLSWIPSLRNTSLGCGCGLQKAGDYKCDGVYTKIKIAL